MARKAWEQLSPSYQRRLARAGITPEQHESGSDIRSARGHRNTPEHGSWGRLAKQRQVDRIVPEWDSLDKATQNRIGRDWVMGYGLTGVPVNSQRRSARNKFDEWFARNSGKNWGKEQWATYRNLYRDLLTMDQSQPYKG